MDGTRFGMTPHKSTTSIIASLGYHNGPILEYPRRRNWAHQVLVATTEYHRKSPPGTSTPPQAQRPRASGYDPAIHGDYDPAAPYAQDYQDPDENAPIQPVDPAAIYAATGTFNRFTGKWQASTVTPENHNDENKSKRQMNAYFDVDAAANSHNGRSLKAERSGKKLTKQELKAFKEKRKEKKEEKRRAWLRD